MRGWAVGWCSIFFFFKQKTAYEMRISDWSSDVCSSDLIAAGSQHQQRLAVQRRAAEQVRHHVVIGRAAGGEDHRPGGEQVRRVAAPGDGEQELQEGLHVRLALGGVGPRWNPLETLDSAQRQAGTRRPYQIGRTSCRDRGCEHEKSSVVGGWYKQ